MNFKPEVSIQEFSFIPQNPNDDGVNSCFLNCSIRHWGLVTARFGFVDSGRDCHWAKKYLPQFLAEAKLLLNLGAVREGRW